MKWNSKVAIFAGLLALGLVSVSLSRRVYAQSSTNLVLYDNFEDERFLDPSRWIPNSACFTGFTLECVREIQEDRLRLAVRNYGATNSTQGTQFGLSELHFTNSALIRSIATQLAVRRTSALGCPTNPTSHGQALITGRFFNVGSGTEFDDLTADLSFDHFIPDPEGVAEVQAFLHWQNEYSFVFLGTINVGQKVIAQLSWDQPHRQFVASWTDVLTGKVTQGLLPYTMSDTTPPTTFDKLVGVRTFADNCVGAQTFADEEATFDKVWIGK